MKLLPISVVIPCGDNSDTLMRAVESVKNQSLHPAQIIVVYNSSSTLADTLRLTLDALQVEIVNFENLIGPSRARNFGVLRSSEEYVAFLDADDEWLSNKLFSQFNFMRENNLQLSTTNFLFADANRSSMYTVKNKNLSFNSLQRRCHIGFGSTAMIRRDALDSSLLFDPQLRRYEDWDFILQALKNKVKIANFDLALSRIHRTPSENWRNAIDSIEIFETKYRKAGYWNRHLASGVALEKAVIAYRKNRYSFFIQVFKSLLLDLKQASFFAKLIYRNARDYRIQRGLFRTDQSLSKKFNR
jgi:glycosyltransferase involved in cell wall biosynthesis